MIKQKKTKTKSKHITLKPVSKDIYYQYICTECGCHHWIKHQEASSKNFHIVCDCDIIISPKRILDTKIIYEKNKKQKNKDKKTVIVDTEKQTIEPIIDAELEAPITKTQKSAMSILEGYGFNKQELEPVIKECLEKDQVAILVKETLTRIGKQHEYFYNQTYEI